MVFRSARAQTTNGRRRTDSWSGELVSGSVRRAGPPWIAPAVKRSTVVLVLSSCFILFFYSHQKRKRVCSSYHNSFRFTISQTILLLKYGICFWKKKKRSGETLIYLSYLLFAQSWVYLCECDWLVFGDVICILAGEHSAVTAVHLLRDFLNEKEMLAGPVQNAWLKLYINSYTPTLTVCGKCHCFIFKLSFSSAAEPAQNRTHAALFAVQSPAWGIHFFALLVFAFLLQVIAVGMKRTSSAHAHIWQGHGKTPPDANKRVEKNLQQFPTRLIVVPTHRIKVEDRLLPEIHHLDR